MHESGLEDARGEAAFYELLKPLQGGAIPALFGISALEAPGAGLLVLELIEGRMLSQLEEITPEVAEAALATLSQVRVLSPWFSPLVFPGIYYLNAWGPSLCSARYA